MSDVALPILDFQELFVHTLWIIVAAALIITIGSRVERALDREAAEAKRTVQ